MKPNTNCKEYLEAVTVERMRESDKYTIENFVSGKELMYRAAHGIYHFYSFSGKKIAIAAGSGNNGGDGYALACILKDNGINSLIYRLSDKFSEDGKYYFDLAKEKGLPDILFSEKDEFIGYDVIVDCIFGTGFKGKPEGISAAAINKINSSGAFVISADINSGLNGNTGEAQLAVKSDLTVSIGFYKTGMFKGDAPSLIGDLVNVDIGIKLV